MRPFRDRHHRVVRRVAPLVGHQEAGEPFDVEGHLGDHRPIGAREVGGDERRLPAVAAEQLDDRDALVRARRGAQGVDELDAPRDRGREPDAVVRAVDVVVHRLRDGDDRDALVVQSQAVRQRVVTADRDQRVESEVLDHAERVLGEVVRPVAFRLAGEEGGHVAGRPGRGSCATCAGSSRRSGRSRGTPRLQRHHVRRDRLLVFGFVSRSPPSRAGCRPPRGRHRRPE